MKEKIIETDSNVFSILNHLNKYIISGHKDGSINIYLLESLKHIKTFKEHKNFVDDLKSYKDGLFLSCSKDHTIKLWDINLETSLKTFTNDSWNYCLIYLNPYNNNKIVTGDYNKNIKIWDVEKGIKLLTINSNHKSGVGRLLYLKNTNNNINNNLILSASNPDIKLWELKKDNCVCIKSFNEHTDWVNALVQIDENTFASGSLDRLIKVWSLTEEKSIKTICVHKSYVTSLIYLKRFFNNEEILLTGSLGKSSKIVDLKTGKVISSLERDEGIFKMELFISEENTPVVISSYWGSRLIKIWGKNN
jgi:WD40 repeat protein